jgi:transposase
MYGRVSVAVRGAQRRLGDGMRRSVSSRKAVKLSTVTHSMVQGGNRPMGKTINSSNGKKQYSADNNRNALGIEKTIECKQGSRNRKAAKPDTKGGTKPQQRWAIRNLLQKLETAKHGGQEAIVEPQADYHIGIDLGDKKSCYCILDKNANVVADGNLITTVTEFQLYFKEIPRSRIALEVGTHSPWVSALLEELGHEVIVANPRKIGGGEKKNRRKNDKLDAEMLARQVKSDPRLLYPIRHRGRKARNALVLLRARYAVVCARTKLICGIRGLVKSDGQRLPRCSAESFHKIPRMYVPEALRDTLEPLFEQIKSLTEQIRKYDAEVKRMCRQAYPETEMLQQPKGVGEITSLAYVLTIDNPGRFAKSRDVGPYLGLVPKQYDSGDSSPQLRITKTGDRMMRQLLVQSAQYILGPFGEDSDLRRQGLKIAARGGKNAKKRAIVAVARKLAVLLHRLWVTAEVYEPLRNSEPKQKIA